MWILGFIMFFPAENFGVEASLPYETQAECLEHLDRVNETPPPEGMEVIVVVPCEFMEVSE